MLYLKKLSVLLAILLFTLSISAQTRSGNGTGKGLRVQSATSGSIQTGFRWIDKNGDGICDNFGTENQGKGQRTGRRGQGRRFNDGSGVRGGSGDGTGVRPQNGSGFGRKTGIGNRTGVCDGTGPRGSFRRGNR